MILLGTHINACEHTIFKVRLRSNFLQNIWHLDILPYLPLVPTNKASATFDKCNFFYVLQFRCKIIGVPRTFVVQDRRNRESRDPLPPPLLQILADQLTLLQSGGTLYPPNYYPSPPLPDFQTFLRSCVVANHLPVTSFYGTSFNTN